MNVTPIQGQRPRVVVVGSGFAGVHAARRLRTLSKGAFEIVLVNLTDHFLYLPTLDALLSRQAVQFGLVRAPALPLDADKLAA